MLFLIIFYIWLVLLGVCVGSFFNVVVVRLPKKGELLSKKRSYCPKCKQTLKSADLIPVVSYLLLKGRCRYCSARISLRYPLVELTGALLAAGSFLRYGFDFRFVITFGVSIILLGIGLIDFDTMEIPDSLILALIPFAVASIWLWPGITLLEHFIGLVTIAFPLFIIAIVIEGAFGGGDIKLMAVCGFMLGWVNVLLAFFFGLLFGGSYAIYLLAGGKRKRGAHIAFGPYLCTGIIIAMFFGKEIISFYLSLFSI